MASGPPCINCGVVSAVGTLLSSRGRSLAAMENLEIGKMRMMMTWIRSGDGSVLVERLMDWSDNSEENRAGHLSRTLLLLDIKIVSLELCL